MTWERLRQHVQVLPAEPAGFVALVNHGDVVALEHGATEAKALAALRRRLGGGPQRKHGRPWLSLCEPCNRRAAAAGDAAHTVGVELCTACAAAVDRYEKATRAYHRRLARNKRKAARRRRARRAAPRFQNIAKHRGHVMTEVGEAWVYADTRQPVAENPSRECGRCGRPPTPDGHDACLGTLPGVANACCGHGSKAEAYVQMENGTCCYGVRAIRLQQQLRGASYGDWRCASCGASLPDDQLTELGCPDCGGSVVPEDRCVS